MKQILQNYQQKSIELYEAEQLVFLRLILVCMRWLMKDTMRFSLSFHGEVCYLVPIQNKYLNAAVAMYTINLLVCSFCISRLNMRDLAISVAFLNSIELDASL